MHYAQHGVHTKRQEARHMGNLEIPLEPYDIDYYDSSGYTIRREWYCPPPLDLTQPFRIIRDDWAWEPVNNTHVLRIFEIEILREEDEDGNIQST
jgi:hypothetical protein